MKLGLGKGKLLALDWDRKTVRMVLVRPRADGVDMLKASSVEIPSTVRHDDAESLGAFIREAMSQVGISASQAMISIPRDHVVLNTLELPPMPADELPAIVQFQITKELPFSAEEAALDFAVSGVFDPKAPVSVLVAAVRREQLNFYQQVVENAGLSVERVGLRPFANLIAVTSRAQELAEKSLLIVEIGPQFTEIDIVRNGRLVFSRAALLALPEHGVGESVTDSRIATNKAVEREEDDVTRQAVSDLMVEIVRSVEAYRATDPAVSLDHIVVCGATGLETHLTQALGARYATTAALFTPDRAMQLAASRAKELRGFNAAIGLAIGHARKGLETIDFLHPKKPVSKRDVQMRKLPLAVATALLFLGSGVTFHYRFVKPLQDQAKKLDLERAKLKKQEEPVVKFKEQVETLEKWIESEQHWPTVLAMLTEVFPAETEAYVSRADFEISANPRTNSLDALMRIRFRTASLGAVNGLTTKLRESGFANVVPGKETPNFNSQDGYRYDTNIDAIVPPPRKDEQPRAIANDTAKSAGTTEPPTEKTPNPVKLPEAKPVDVKPANAKPEEPKPAEVKTEPKPETQTPPTDGKASPTTAKGVSR
ncbi:MAG: pilus assembly protein PilM [Planctomycetes bacterium]|nr:pilus assembly protein PilM [Planctomycetota bacterium]